MRRSRGLTMLEMVMAIALLFLSASFVMSMFITGSRVPQHVEHNQKMDMLAQAQMDRVIAEGSYFTTTGPFPCPTPFTGTVTETSANSMDSDFQPDALIVTVRVSDGAGQFRELKTIKTNAPPPAPGYSLIVNDLTCLTCHSMQAYGGGGQVGSTAGAAPPWTRAQLQANASAAGVSLDQYIRDSVRNPSAFVNTSSSNYYYTDPSNGQNMSYMTTFNTAALSDADLDAVVNYMVSQLP